MTIEMLKAGRELDALVAVHVFGQIWLADELGGNGRAIGAGHAMLWDQKDWDRVNEDRKASGDTCRLKRATKEQIEARLAEPYEEAYLYSTEIESAWDVVERMRSLGYVFDLKQLTDGTWHAQFYSLNLQRGDYSGYELTAPVAISIAALKALGVE